MCQGSGLKSVKDETGKGYVIAPCTCKSKKDLEGKEGL